MFLVGCQPEIYTRSMQLYELVIYRNCTHIHETMLVLASFQRKKSASKGIVILIEQQQRAPPLTKMSENMSITAQGIYLR